MSILQLRDYEEEILERIKKHGPKDTSYITVYDKKHIPKIRKKIGSEQWREGFVQASEARLNDHHTVYDGIEFLDVSKSDDLLMLRGLRSFMLQILGTDTTRYKFGVVGTDGAQARPYQNGLFGEVTPRIDMTLPGNGSIARSGSTTLVFTCIFPSSFPTLTIRESGISTASPGGIFLNRNVYASPSTHTSGVSGFTLTTNISFSIVTTFL